MINAAKNEENKEDGKTNDGFNVNNSENKQSNNINQDGNKAEMERDQKNTLLNLKVQF